jgi:hypothetical protein
MIPIFILQTWLSGLFSLVLTHGWGLDTREWNYLKRDLLDRFRSRSANGRGTAQHLPMDSQVHEEPSAAVVATAASEAQCTHTRGKAVLFDG